MNQESVFERTVRRMRRARFAYWSVMTGANPVIGTSQHQYQRFKNWLLYLSAALPVLFHNSILKSAVRLTRSNRLLLVLPVFPIQATAGLYAVAIPASVTTMFLGIQGWSTMRSMYFASYLATIAFCIDDPNHRIYKTSKIMRNAI